MENNRTAFVALIERYETIGLEEIQEAWDSFIKPIVSQGIEPDRFSYGEWQGFLTGLGDRTTCSLCIAADDYCTERCVYGHALACISAGHLRKSYEAMRNSATPEQLLEAYRNRANVMREVLRKFDERNGINP